MSEECVRVGITRRKFFLQSSTLTFWCLGLVAEGRLPRATRMWCSLRFDQTSFVCLHQIWSAVVAVLRICLHVSNAEILGTAQRFATAAPIKECSNEPLKIITGVRTVVNFRAKSRKMGSCNPFSIHQGLVAQFRVDNQCFLGKIHDRHLKCSRYMLWLEFQDVTFWRWDLLWFAVASL